MAYKPWNNKYSTFLSLITFRLVMVMLIGSFIAMYTDTHTYVVIYIWWFMLYICIHLLHTYIRLFPWF